MLQSSYGRHTSVAHVGIEPASLVSWTLCFTTELTGSPSKRHFLVVETRKIGARYKPVFESWEMPVEKISWCQGWRIFYSFKCLWWCHQVFRQNYLVAYTVSSMGCPSIRYCGKFSEIHIRSSCSLQGFKERAFLVFCDSKSIVGENWEHWLRELQPNISGNCKYLGSSLVYR